jgi:RNA polymerase-binding transcription factor DksA
MMMSVPAMRQTILTKLNQHLQDNYSISLPREDFADREYSLHQIDAVLAFKSDQRLEELRNALSRLDEGTFGFCLSCKGPISEDILDANPIQRVCARCEKQYSHVEQRSFRWPLVVANGV